MKKEHFFEIALPLLKNLAGFGKLVNVPKEEGYLVVGSSVTPWFFTGSRVTDGVVSLYGPFCRGVSLSETLSLDRTQALKSLLVLTRACQALLAAGKHQVEISLESVYFMDDGGVLFLPPGIFRKIRGLIAETDQADFFRINNPYLNDFHLRASHSIAVLAYKILSGAYPYDGKTPDEIRAQIRLARVLPPHLVRPEIKDSVSKDLLDFFQNKKSVPRTLSTWNNLITGWLENGYEEKRSRQEKSARKTEKSRSAILQKKSLSRALFWEKNGRTVLFAALGIAGAAAFILIILLSILKPRQTSGFSPEKIVATYYETLNSLEVELMKDCLTDNAAAAEFQRTQMMFLAQTQMMAYEQRTTRIAADQWAKNGRPKVTSPQFVDGVIGVVITQEQGEPNPVFTADYERWLYQEGFEMSDANRGYATMRKDRLFLKKDGSDWLIYKIENLETTPVTIE